MISAMAGNIRSTRRIVLRIPPPNRHRAML
jgi:hypothetical protein